MGLREVPGALRLIDDPENLPKALGSLKQLTNLQVEFDASFPIQKLHSDTTWIPEGVTEVAARVKLLQEGLNLASRLGQATDAKEFGVRARRLVMGMESAVLERKSNASVPSPSSVLDVDENMRSYRVISAVTSAVARVFKPAESVSAEVEQWLADPALKTTSLTQEQWQTFTEASAASNLGPKMKTVLSSIRARLFDELGFDITVKDISYLLKRDLTVERLSRLTPTGMQSNSVEHILFVGECLGKIAEKVEVDLYPGIRDYTLDCAKELRQLSSYADVNEATAGAFEVCMQRIIRDVEQLPPPGGPSVQSRIILREEDRRKLMFIFMTATSKAKSAPKQTKEGKSTPKPALNEPKPKKAKKHGFCKKFLQGTCLSSDACGLNHKTAEELKKIPCKKIKDGVCPFGDDCVFGHEGESGDEDSD